MKLTNISYVWRKKIMTVTVSGYLILISRDFYDFISPIYQPLKTVFDHIS